MVDVTVSYDVSDISPVITALSVASNEGGRDDWQIVDAHHVRLRADRWGAGNGRTYTITISSTDSAGNASTKILLVYVPHDQGDS
jgi:hypothetical protein